MKKLFRKTLALFMVLVFVFTSVPFTSNAKNDDYTGVDTKSEASFGNQTALDIIANGLMEGETNESYAVSYLEMSGTTVIVDVGNIAECKLVVAIYDEDTRQMYASGIADVPLEHGKIEVEIDIESLPQYYIVKAFLVDENYAPLCDAYESLMYTSAYEQFLAVTPEDYDGEEVIVFDDTKEQTDFAVVDSSAITSEMSDDMTFEYDETTLTFTFYNAIDDVKKLKVGDIYYYEYGDLSNEFLLFKVKSVSVSGSTVTIVQDENVSLSEVFSFVRIDAEGDYDNAQIDESTLGEVFTPVEESEPEIITNGIANTPSATESFSTSLNLSYKNPGTGISISGAVAFTMTASVKLSYDPSLFGFDYFEFKSENKFVVKLAGISVTGKIALPEVVSKFPVAVIPIGPFTLSLNIHLIAELSASISFDITYEENLIVTADLDSGVKKTTTAESDWDAKLNDKIEIKIGLGLEIKLSFAIVSLSVSGSGGLKYSGNTDTVGVWTNKHHDCLVCTNGKVLLFVDFNIKLSIELGTLDLGWDAIKWSEEWNLFDFYISLNKDGFSCGKGACDRIWYKVNVTVKDTNKSALSGVRVFTDTGVCDADGDGNYNETEMLTNKDGKATFYFQEGSHSIVAKCDGYIMETEVVNIIAKEKSVTIYLKPDTSAEPEKPTEPEKTTEPEKPEVTYIASGICGDNLTWTLDEEGILVINGTGTMWNCFGDAPWSSYRSYIKIVKIGNGVTSVGECAFYDCYELVSVTFFDSVTTIDEGAFSGCTSLISITIPDGVTTIGMGAFSGCTSLISITIPDSVTTIDSDAFSACISLTSIKIPNSITTIGNDAFFNCFSLASITVDASNKNYSNDSYGVLFNKNKTALIKYPEGNARTSYTIPDSVRTIGDYAFYDCISLTSITIPDGVTTIGMEAFSGCTSLISITIPNNVTTIGNGAFDGCNSLTNVKIPVGVTTICRNTFNGCDSLTNIKIPDSVRTIGDYAFEGCKSLTSIKIPDGVTAIGDGAFLNCVSLTSITIPSGVTNIGSATFGLCISLACITIPDTVTAIYEYAFAYCDSITDVYYIGTLKQWNQISIGSDNECLTNATIHYNSNIALASESLSLNNMGILLNSSTTEPESFVIGGCVSGNNYIMLSVTDYSNGFILTTDNLYYIDQLVADESGTVSTSFIPKLNDKRTTTLLIGDFGNGVKVKVIKAGYDYSDCKISITPYSDLNINYGDIVQYSVVTNNMPAGAKIVWTVLGKGAKINPSNDGKTCKVIANGNGTVTIKASVVDETGKPLLNINGNAIHSARKLTIDGSFWNILLYFIRTLFGISRTIIQTA